MFNIYLITLSMVIASMYGAMFHLLWGATLKDWIISWIAGLVGFGVGQILSAVFPWREMLRIGELDILSASAVCWLFMAFARRTKL